MKLGGKKLQLLRKKAQMAQMDVEVDAGLGIGSFSLYESGRREPKRETLERILEVLGAKYNEQKEILESFGYLTNTPLPTNEEITWARTISQPILDNSPVPAYLMDCSTRVLASNKFIPSMNFLITGKTQLEELYSRPLIEIVYDETHPLRYLAILENDLSIQVKSLCVVLAPYQNESWCQEMIKKAKVSLPIFNEFWEYILKKGQPEVIDYRSRFMTINISSMGELKFFRHTEGFVSDSRFRLIYWIPTEHNTIEVVEKWHKELSEK